MTKHSRTVPAFLIAAIMATPRGGQAQTFKVAKANIGGEGGTDYLTAEPGTGRVFVSRGTHVMVVDGTTEKVLGDIPDTPRTHGVATMRGAKTIAVDPAKHVAYLFQPEYGPPPASAPGAPPPQPGFRGPRGPVVAAWFFAISH